MRKSPFFWLTQLLRAVRLFHCGTVGPGIRHSAGRGRRLSRSRYRITEGVRIMRKRSLFWVNLLVFGTFMMLAMESGVEAQVKKTSKRFTTPSTSDTTNPDGT